MLSEKIIGVWELQSWETVVDDKVVGYPLGEKASGFLAYHPIGFMSVNISAPNRVRIPTDRSLRRGPKALGIRRQGISRLLWSILDCVGERTHPPPEALFLRELGGSRSARDAQLNENTLTLSTAPRLLLGKQGIGRLTWKRVTTFT